MKLRLPILAKVMAPSMLVVALLCTLGYQGYKALEDVQTSFATTERRAVLSADANALQALLYRQEMAARGYLLNQDQASLMEFQTTGKRVTEAIKQLESTATVAATRKQFEEIMKDHDQYTQDVQIIFDQMKAGLTTVAVQQQTIVIKTQVDEMVNLADNVSSDLTQKAQEGFTQANSTAEGKQALMEWVSVASVLVGVILSWLVAQLMTKPIRALAVLARRVADGDLQIDTKKSVSRDEIGDVTLSFHEMADSLRKLIQQVAASGQVIQEAVVNLSAATEESVQATDGVSRAADQVAQGASSQSNASQETARIVEELRTAVTQIAAGAQEQASRTQGTADVMNRMIADVENVTTRSDLVLETATRTATAAARGDEVVGRTEQGMHQIRTAVFDSAAQIRALSDFSNQINEFTSVITEIADQTNLLALNAAIEAARAGEHGRGFAVVAEEVRKLAERSSRSAGEIVKLVSNIQSGTAGAIASMDHVTQEVEAGTQLTSETRQALEAIVSAIGEAKENMEGIASATQRVMDSSGEVLEAINAVAAVTEQNTAATEQMAAGSDQVSRAVQDMAAVSQENAAAAEEVSASMEELKATAVAISTESQRLIDTARQLQDQVGRFKI